MYISNGEEFREIDHYKYHQGIHKLTEKAFNQQLLINMNVGCRAEKVHFYTRLIIKD